MIEDHNSRRWLEVVELTEGGSFPGRSGRHSIEPGWYVIRVCPCHYQQPVTLAYATEAEAQRAAEIMVETSMRLGT